MGSQVKTRPSESSGAHQPARDTAPGSLNTFMEQGATPFAPGAGMRLMSGRPGHLNRVPSE